MEPALTPSLGLAYLRELSTDVRGGIVLDAAYARLAGDARLEPGARALLEAIGGGCEWTQVRASQGWVFAATPADLAIVAVTGPYALPGLIRHDMSAVTAMLAMAKPPPRPPDQPRPALRGAPYPTLECALPATGDHLSRLAEALHGALPPVAGRLDSDR